MSAGDDGQSYRERPPRPELGHVLSCVWVQEVSAERTPYEHRTVPNGSAEIACLLDSGALRVTGPRRTSALAALAPGATVVGLRLRPGAASSLLGPASELVDLELGLEAIWGRAAAVLGESLAHAGSAEIAARMLEQELLMRCAGRLEPDPVVAEAVRRLEPWRRAGLARAAAELFVSPRQLRRRFATALGFGPKTVQGILRFQGFLALSNARRARRVTLARLAAAVGYADQAHLTRECVRLTGLTPSSFLDELRRSCGATHDHDASFAPLRTAILEPARS